MPRCKRGTLGMALWMLGGVSVGGCSFLFVDAPSDGAKNLRSVEALDCTASRAWPTTDVIVGSVMALESFATFSDGNSGFNTTASSSTSAYIVPAVAAAGAALFVASGVSGYRHTSECRQAKRDIQLRELPNGPPGMPPPRGFAPGYAPYAPMAAPPPYDPWTAQPAAPPPSPRPGPPGDPAWGAPAPASPGAPPAAPVPPPVAPATPPGGW